MTDLTIGQYTLVYNILSFVIAAMGASTVFFFFSRDLVLKKYRLALYVSGIVTLIACYHYFRIFNSWEAAYTLSGDSYKASGVPFNDAYRYVDWLLTVPLLLVELVAVLNLAWDKSKHLLLTLVPAAFLMILLGYPGEIATDSQTRWIFFVLSMIPFLYILYVLYFRLGDSLSNQPEKVVSYVSLIRNLTLVAWSFYPIAYLFNEFRDTGFGLTAVQVGYSIADVVAKCGYGIIIFWIARAKTEADGGLAKE
ncbi:MAG: bacteriorhodopsin-like [Parachlamydiaceae bacterium]